MDAGKIPVPSPDLAVRSYLIKRAEISGGEGCVWLDFCGAVIQAYVREYFKSDLHEGAISRGYLSLDVYGGSIYGNTSINRSSSDAVFVRQQDDCVESRVKLLSVIGVSTSVMKTGTVSRAKLSFSALADTSRGGLAVLAVVDCNLESVSISDVLEGRAIPMFRPTPDSAAGN